MRHTIPVMRVVTSRVIHFLKSIVHLYVTQCVYFVGGVTYNENTSTLALWMLYMLQITVTVSRTEYTFPIECVYRMHTKKINK